MFVICNVWLVMSRTFFYALVSTTVEVDDSARLPWFSHIKDSEF